MMRFGQVSGPQSSTLEMEKTHLIQLSISKIGNSAAVFNAPHPKGTPIVLTLRGGGSSCCPCCCCNLKLDVPDGITVIEHVWGRHNGILKPGSQWCYCCTHSIEYILTRGAIRYDAPVKACPTKDNIYVEIDIMLILRLGENHRDVKNFIYKLGARRLDSLLKNESQESIRNFARLHKHYEVPDLKSELSATLITGLNEKFNQFGVHFEHVAITAIKLPQEIERTFADTTLYDIKLQKQIKQYENSKLLIDNKEEWKITNLTKTNLRKEEEMIAAKKRAKIEREMALIVEQSNYNLAVLGAKKKEDMLKITVQGEKVVAHNRSKKTVIEAVAKITAECDSKVILTDERAKASLIEAEGLLKSTKYRSDAVGAESKAEQTISSQIQSKRDFEYKMAKLEALDGMAVSGNMIIGGTSGDVLLNSIVDTLKY